MRFEVLKGTAYAVLHVSYIKPKSLILKETIKQVFHIALSQSFPFQAEHTLQHLVKQTREDISLLLHPQPLQKLPFEIPEGVTPSPTNAS